MKVSVSMVLFVGIFQSLRRLGTERHDTKSGSVCVTLNKYFFLKNQFYLESEEIEVNGIPDIF